MLAVPDMTGPQMAVMGGSYAGMSPMIIMNNFVLKQVKQYLSPFYISIPLYSCYSFISLLLKVTNNRQTPPEFL